MKLFSVISFLILGMILISFNIQPALAGDIDILIKKLVEKKILTQSEAQELVKEIQKENAKERAEIKEVAQEIAKKEVESRPVELPAGLKGITLGGTYFLEYYKKDFDDDTRNDDFNSFRVERAYLTLKKKFAPWFESRLTGDITYDAAKTKGWEFRMKYAYGKFNFNELGGSPVNFESEVGLVHTASDDYDAALWPYRPQGKHYLDRHSIMASADFGMNFQFTLGSMDEEFKNKVSNKYAGKWGGIWAGVYNGAGYDNQEANDSKVVEALVYVRPFNMINVLNGLRIGYHIMRGESDSLLAGGPPKQYPYWDIDQFMASFQHEYFTIIGQSYDGQSRKRDTDEKDHAGYNIAAFVKMPFDKKFRAFGRYDVYDHDKARANFKEKTTIGGISYDLSKGVMPWAAIEDTDYESGLGLNDFRQYQVGLSIDF